MDSNALQDQGTFVISIDLELIWGFIHRPDFKKFTESVRNVRKTLPRLLQLLSVFDVGVTIAAVGQLMTPDPPEETARQYGLPLELFWARDLIGSVDQGKHEIGIHGHRHRFFDELSEAQAEEDINLAIESARSLDVQVESMVFPQNRIHHLQIAQRCGIRFYRGVDPWWFNRLPSVLRRPAHLADQMLGLRPPVVCAQSVAGVVQLINIPGSMILMSRDGVRKMIPIAARVKKIKRGIDRAISSGRIFHLWFHPHNLSCDSDAMLAALKEILDYANAKRSAGQLAIKTMNQVEVT